MVTRPRFAYVQIKLASANKIKGEGAVEDQNHKPTSSWIPVYDFTYRVYGRDKSHETGRAQNLAQLAVTFWKEAMNNASIELFQSIASGAQIEWAVLHVMGKDEKTGEAMPHYKFTFEDGGIAAFKLEDRLTDKGIDTMEKLELTFKKVGFKQEVLGKGDVNAIAGYNFNTPGEWKEVPGLGGFDGQK